MKPFLSDRPRVSTPTHSATAAPSGGAFALAGASAPAGGHASHNGESPRIECVREGDRITRLVITCGCGERIEIDCLYAAGK